MNALEMRELASNKHIRDTEEYIVTFKKLISKKALDGEFKVIIKDLRLLFSKKLHQHVINELQNLGFTVTSDIISNTLTIEW